MRNDLQVIRLFLYWSIDNLLKYCFQVLVQCEMSVTGSGLKLIDVKKLHCILIQELAAIQGSSTAGQRHLILQEIQVVF
jgi:hypothetical protein